MQVRRWKEYISKEDQEQRLADREPKPASLSETGKAKPKKRVVLQFINASHPCDAASADAKKMIRAHVARDVHASRRAQQAQAGQTNVGRTNRDTSNNQTSSAFRRVDQAALAEAEAEGGEAVSDTMCTPEPASLLSSARKDPFQSFARAITETEYYLIDYYLNTVVPQAGSYCDHGDEEPLFLAGMRSHWLPLAFSDTGLLCGVLLAACRSLIAHQAPLAVNGEYAEMALRYKVECIRSTSDAIAADSTSASDTTIAKALIMYSDERLYGDSDASGLHADAIVRMVTLKGGLQNLGVGGFLRRMVTWCVLNPRIRASSGIALE